MCVGHHHVLVVATPYMIYLVDNWVVGNLTELQRGIQGDLLVLQSQPGNKALKGGNNSRTLSTLFPL